MIFTYYGKNLLVDDKLIEFITDKLKEEQLSGPIRTLLDAEFDIFETAYIITSLLGENARLCGKAITWWTYEEDNDKKKRLERSFFACVKRDVVVRKQ